MNRRFLICSVILGLVSVAGAAQGQNPTNVCPQWKWGNTANTIFHYYSEYIEVTGTGCVSHGWDNYDGADNLPTTGSCSNTGVCIAFRKDAEKAQQAARAQRSETQAAVARRPQTAPDIMAHGLKSQQNPDFVPTHGPGVFVRDRINAYVMITATKRIRVKLFIVLLNPHVQGQLDKPAILIANGVEIKDVGNALFTIPNGDVVRLGANAYDITVGQIVYRVITHDET